MILIKEEQEEIWREIPGYSNYEASNLGNIRRKGADWVFKQCKDTHGYLSVGVKADSSDKITTTNVHRLVAMTFIPNPNNLPEVGHKDENKENNNISNFEWCTRSENQTAGTMRERQSKAHDVYKKPVAMYDADGNLLKLWESIKASAIELGKDKSNIRKYLNGSRKPLNGNIFKFIDKDTYRQIKEQEKLNADN